MCIRVIKSLGKSSGKLLETSYNISSIAIHRLTLKYTTVTVSHDFLRKLKSLKPFKTMSHEEFLSLLLEQYKNNGDAK